MAQVLNPAQAPFPLQGLTIDDELVSLVPQALELKQTPGAHETMTLSVLLPTIDTSEFTDSSIYFEWGPNNQPFAGYIRSVQNVQDFQKQPMLRIECMGVSWEMSSGTPTFYTNRTGPSMIEEVVTRNKLGCVVDDHWYSWPRKAQTTQSDWRFINDLADDLGYYLVVTDGVVRVMDPIRALDVQAPVADLLKASDLLSNEQILLDFTPSVVSEKDRMVSPPKAGFFQEDGSVGFINPDSVIFNSGTFLADSMRAKVYEETLIKSRDTWIYTATCRTKGKSFFHPGQVVNVVSGGSDTVVNADDGLWFIVSAVHSLNAETYQTSLGLARDHSRPRKGSNTFWGGLNHAQPQFSKINGRWVSTWR